MAERLFLYSLLTTWTRTVLKCEFSKANPEVVVRRCSVKKMFWKNSQNSQENTSLLLKLQIHSSYHRWSLLLQQQKNNLIYTNPEGWVYESWGGMSFTNLQKWNTEWTLVLTNMIFNESLVTSNKISRSLHFWLWKLSHKTVTKPRFNQVGCTYNLLGLMNIAFNE